MPGTSVSVLSTFNLHNSSMRLILLLFHFTDEETGLAGQLTSSGLTICMW